MRRPTLWLVVLVGCASPGGAPAGPLTWPPGQYYLEATVSYTSRFGPQQDLHSADLYIESDGRALLLAPHTDVCRDPPPAQLQADEARGVRSFLCGDVTFELRPVSGTVTGQLLRQVAEAFQTRVCQARAFDNPQGRCVRWVSEDRERMVTKRERLRVAGER
jgi:hypothetical protein